MPVTTFTERVRLSGKVDRDAGVIRGVRVCGASSANGNDYAAGSFGNCRQYEGRHVYLNHDHAGRERSVADKLGWLENVRPDADGTPRGDFHILKSHPAAGSVLEAAERNPSLFGFSHVARCRYSPAPGGRKRVEAVEEVQSVDLVSTPATTGGFFESATTRGVTVSTTNKAAAVAALERVAAASTGTTKRKLWRALESLAVAGDSTRAASEAFRAAGVAVLDELFGGGLTLADALAKLKDLHAGHLAAGGTATGGRDGDADTLFPVASGVESRRASRATYDRVAGRIVLAEVAPTAAPGERLRYDRARNRLVGS